MLVLDLGFRVGMGVDVGEGLGSVELLCDLQIDVPLLCIE